MVVAVVVVSIIVTYVIQFFRIGQVLFNFTLSTIYQKGIIEDYNPVEVKFTVHIRLHAHNHLHSSHVNVEVEVEPMLTRMCNRSSRAKTTVIDSVVIVLAMLASIGYSLSVIRSIRLAKVSRSLSTLLKPYFKAFCWGMSNIDI